MTKELAIPQWINILFLLEIYKPKEIYKKADISISIVYKTMKQLEKQGYIKRQLGKTTDYREKTIITTDKGKELLKACKIICNLEKPKNIFYKKKI